MLRSKNALKMYIVVLSRGLWTVSEKYIWEILKICTKMSLVVERKPFYNVLYKNDSNKQMLCFVSEKKKKASS